MIEMLKSFTVLINLFRRKSGVHPVMSPSEAQSDNTKDLSDEDDNDEADVTSKSNQISRELDLNLGNFWESSYSHVVSSMVIAEEVGIRMMKEYFESEV